MVLNEEILGGLKSALERGESLKRAMMTFFNSGYKKEEIEEAARALSASGLPAVILPPQPVAPASPLQSTKVQTTTTEPSVPEEPLQVPQVQQVQTSTVKQKVSNYGDDSKDKTLIFILISVLVFLFGVLLTIFLFKDELIDFFSSFFA